LTARSNTHDWLTSYPRTNSFIKALLVFKSESSGNVISKINSTIVIEAPPIMKATLQLLALAGAVYLSNAHAQVILAPAVAVAPPPPPVIVAPPRAVVVAPPAVAPVGVAYVAPVGIAPAAGYLWRYHVGVGWGWWHPRLGWHGPVAYHHWGYRR
jgi:hypothetical protein